MFGSRRIARLMSACGVVVLGAAWHSPAAAQVAVLPDPPKVAPVTSIEDGWPGTYETALGLFTVYPPQVESWEGPLLRARAAVAFERIGAAGAEYGTITFTARTTLAGDTVSISDVRVREYSFPAAADRGASYVAALEPRIVASPGRFSASELQTSLVIARAAQGAGDAGVANDPPRIIVSDRPAALVVIDGEPALRPYGPGVERVINTRALILLENGAFHLRAFGGWLRADSVAGPWTPEPFAPAGVEAGLRSAIDDPAIDLLEPGPGAEGSAVVYVTTEPAELVQTRGAPNFTPVPGTGLLYASNAETPLILNLDDQKFYVLLSGRWFRASGLEKGDWEYVDHAAVPEEFARIPAAHPAGSVLASVAGTPQSQEAAISNSIPRIAEIDRETAGLEVTYDGSPVFEAVDGTDLRYAVNTATPVIEVAPSCYYACRDAVWFTAKYATGPWVVAVDVPAVVYTIPVRHRLHHVTYCRVYRWTPRTVYCGYTPGYYGTFVSRSGCVVYGAGYRYRSWCGTVWTPAPCTYGWGVGISIGSRSGWSFTFSSGWRVGTWWSPCGPSFDRYAWHRRHDSRRWTPDCDAFRSWDRCVVARHDGPHWGSRNRDRDWNDHGRSDRNGWSDRGGRDRWDGDRDRRDWDGRGPRDRGSDDRRTDDRLADDRRGGEGNGRDGRAGGGGQGGRPVADAAPLKPQPDDQSWIRRRTVGGSGVLPDARADGRSGNGVPEGIRQRSPGGAGAAGTAPSEPPVAQAIPKQPEFDGRQRVVRNAPSPAPAAPKAAETPIRQRVDRTQPAPSVSKAPAPVVHQAPAAREAPRPAPQPQAQAPIRQRTVGGGGTPPAPKNTPAPARAPEVRREAPKPPAAAPAPRPAANPPAPAPSKGPSSRVDRTAPPQQESGRGKRK